MASKRMREMMNVLRLAGDRFAGATPDLTAQQWMECGFDADSAESWVAIGCWDASVAECLRDHGLTSSEVFAGAESLLGVGGPFTDGCPIYSVCNGDTPIDVLVNAAMATRRA